ncbi:MAG: DNA-binding protein [Deltaproteobacteria bacterium]|nr:DNA-binding protein [Deltaproteobacteria bacterium]
MVYPKNLNTIEAAAYLTSKGIPYSKKTLEVFRCKKRGPKYKKIVSRVYYERSWLDEFVAGLEVKIFDPAKM